MMREIKIEKKLPVTTLPHDKVVLTVSTPKELDEQTIEEIKSLNMSIMWNQAKAVHYSFGKRLSNGLFLDNIVFNDKLTAAAAIIN